MIRFFWRVWNTRGTLVELWWNFGGTLTELSKPDNQRVVAFFGGNLRGFYETLERVENG